MKKLIDYKVLQEANSDILAEKVLEFAKDGYELNGGLVVTGEYQYTIFIQCLIKYEN
jgi:hypothetical protein